LNALAQGANLMNLLMMASMAGFPPKGMNSIISNNYSIVKHANKKYVAG
jgi:hypothetical protein